MFTDANMKRGNFAYFGKKKLRTLYEIGKKNHNSYRYPNYDFAGKFQKFEPDFYQEYLKLKEKSLLSVLGSTGAESTEFKGEIKQDFVKNTIEYIESEGIKVSNTLLASIFNYHRNTIGKFRKDVQENTQKSEMQSAR